MNILVTGGSGLVGKYIVNKLARKYEVSILDIQIPEAGPCKQFFCVDILDLSKLSDVLKGFEIVVHAAAIPHSLEQPAEKVFTVNVMGAFNVLEASARSAVKKVIFVSSESTLGFAFMTKKFSPEYIPIDEQHALCPQDPYGLSKVIGEQICRTFSDRYGIRTICLRAPWVWVPEEKEISLYRDLVNQYEQWYKNLWAYVHVDDFAYAVRLAVEATNLSVHDIFFITANENWTAEDSRELLRRFYPDVSKIAASFQGKASLISNEKAKRLLGYQPRHSAKNIFEAHGKANHH